MCMPDYHIHTRFSPDSSMLHTQAIEAACISHLTDICFTEHMDLGHHMPSFNRIPDFKQIRESISCLRLRYPHMHIGYGLEAGYIAEYAAETAKAISQEPLDYVLLSVHCVDGIDCYLPESRRGRNKAYAYRRYLETVHQSVCDPVLLPFYDCVGHIGYIAKCGHYPDSSFPHSLFPDMLDEILMTIIRNGKGIEVNTSGIAKAGHTLPHPSIICRYRELGGKIITLGSDAHTPERVGEHITSAIQIIKDCGFHEITTFDQHIPQFHAI